MNRYRAIWYPASLATLTAIAAMLALPSWLAGVFVLACVLLVMDCRARLKDYDRLVLMIEEWGFIPSIYEPFLRTRCSREVLRYAAYETGRSNSVPVIYRKHGYRWFHLAPDNTLSRNSPFIKPRFYRAALGV